MPRIFSPAGIALLIALFALAGCTRVVIVQTPVDSVPSGPAVPSQDERAWWNIAFQLRWDGEQAPDWYLDALLADQVCAPALVDLGAQIDLWRFHRRAANDGAGHRFSLLVYTDTITAEVLIGQIRQQSVLQWLESDGYIESVTMTEMNRPELAPVARSSDAAWPPEIQASWPWFIMGVSQTWLSLIKQVTAEQPLEDPSPDALLDYYAAVNNRVTALWRDLGQHVYLHHLNALFGYEPLVIRETNLKRF
jgi:hypothetical protein